MLPKKDLADVGTRAQWFFDDLIFQTEKAD